MENQIFKLIGRNYEEIGYVAKSKSNKMIMILKDFLGPLVSTRMTLKNMDKFVDSLFSSEKFNKTAVIEFENYGFNNIICIIKPSVIDGYDILEISLYVPIAGKIFSEYVRVVGSIETFNTDELLQISTMLDL